MNVLTSLKNDIIALLAANVENTAVTDEFTSAKKQVPLRGGIVAVRVQAVECQNAAFDTYLGDGADGGQVYGRPAKITLCFDICTGVGTKSSESYSVFECIAQALFNSSYKISRLWSDELKFDRQLDGFLLKAYAAIESYLVLSQGETQQQLNNINLLYKSIAG